jgi:hypothetical protein
MSALPLTTVRVREPLGLCKQVTRTTEEGKDERAPQGVTPEQCVGTVPLRCGSRQQPHLPGQRIGQFEVRYQLLYHAKLERRRCGKVHGRRCIHTWSMKSVQLNNNGLSHHLSVSSISISKTFPSSVMILYGAATRGVRLRKGGSAKVLTPWGMRIRNHVAKVYHGFREGSSHDSREFLAL